MNELSPEQQAQNAKLLEAHKNHMQSLHDNLKKPQEPESVPEGWWLISDLAGSVEGVCKAIDGRSDIDQHWKSLLKTELAAFADENKVNFLHVDGHYFFEKKKLVIHLDISGKAVAA